MYKLTVKGVVQGVGFRPFVYRLAKSMGLKGYVRNMGNGTVEIVIDRNPELFIERMKDEKPPISRIDEVFVETVEFEAEDFLILRSAEKKADALSLPPPDVAICGKCLEELFDESDRRYLYSFISCTDCGARFSVAITLPYDRENTTFSEFPLCEECRNEYENVMDRRYYAQSIACPKCGPDYLLFNHKKERLAEGYEAIKMAARLIDSSHFIAVKGIGGYHIACITDDDVVFELRKKLRREQQPFAIMARNMEKLKEIAVVNAEANELESYIRPIVVLKKKNRDAFYAVAPELDTIGVMLPYSPAHYLLFENMKADFIVMTSANLPGEPMFIDDGVFELDLDYYLVHNLRINNRIDDSVIKFVNGRRMIIRKSRGFIPHAFRLESRYNGVALGAELYNSICFLKDSMIIQSQYIGNTADFRTFNEFFKKSLNFFQNFLSMDSVDFVFCDLHPLYNTSQFAEKLVEKINARLIRIQHHFAHGMSVMNEKSLDRAVAISVDGVGYGYDGTIWGGEVIYIDLEEGRFERIGRLEDFRLIGGDLAGEYPLRILFSLVYDYLGDYDLLRGYEKYLRENENFELFESLMDRNLSTILSTSTGRMLDAASAMLEVCFRRTYEGEPAMKLEAIAVDTDPDGPEIGGSREGRVYPVFADRVVDGRKGEVSVLKTKRKFVECLERYADGEDRGVIAGEIIAYLAEGLAEIACRFAERKGLPVVLSGGVAYNTIFNRHVYKKAEEYGVKVHINEYTAAGDNGISFGQIYLSKYLDVEK